MIKKKVFAILVIALLFTPLMGVEKVIHLKTEDLEDAIGMRAFRMNSKGEIFLFSSRMSRIFKFKPDGSFEKSFCRKGEGPGEITRVISMFQNPTNDYLYLPEFSSRSKGRITIFDSEGNYKGLLKPELSLSHMDRVSKMMFLKDGSYILVTSERVDWKPVGKYYITQDEILCRYFSKEGKLKSNILKTMDDGEFSNAPRYGGPRMFFVPRTIMRLAPGEQIVVAKTDNNIFSFYNTDGKKTKTITLNIAREKLSDEEFDKRRKSDADYFSRHSDARMAKLARNMYKYDYKPFYTTFYANSKYLLLSKISKRNASGYPKQTAITAFDYDGKRIGSTVVDGFVVYVTEDFVVVRTYDEDLNEYVRIEPSRILNFGKITKK